MKRIPDRVWLGIVVALASVAGVASVLVVFSAPLTIEDDARQFVFWMADWRDKGLFGDDLVASYWRSVSPWLFTAFYRGLDFIGVEPVTTARLLPAILFPLTGLFGFRFARAISSDACVACGGAIFLVLLLMVDYGVVSATPRAFAPLFFLIFLDGLVRRSIPTTAVSLFCLAGVYPATAIIAVTTLSIALIDFRERPRIDVSRANLTLVAVGVLAAVGGVVPFLAHSAQFGPVVTPDTATQFATFGSGGRSSVFRSDGSLDFVCQERIGVFRGCEGFLQPLLLFAALSVAPTLLLVRHIRSGGKTGSAIPFFVEAASVIWFVIAVFFAFKLHVPSRFVLRVAAVSIVLPLGVVVSEIVRKGVTAAFVGRVRLRAEVALIAFVFLTAAILGIVGLRHSFFTWRHTRLAAEIASLPAGATVAGFVMDADFVPILAKRRVLFSYELAVAYHLGYYRQIDARMRDMAEAELTPDAAVLADRLSRYAIDVYLVDKERLAKRSMDARFARMLGDFVERKKAELGGASTAMAQLAPGCLRGTFDGIEMLDVPCLISAARQESVSGGEVRGSSRNPPQR